MDEIARGFLFGLGLLCAVFAVWLAIAGPIWLWRQSFWWRREVRLWMLARFKRAQGEPRT